MTILSRLVASQERAGDPPPPAIVVRANNGCRFALTYVWDPGAPILPWLMLNPAYAGTKSAFDLTARRVIRFSWRWGFGGALLLNLVPVITPDTDALRDWLRWPEREDWEARDQLFYNWDVLREMLALHDAAIAAWGAVPDAWSTMERYAFDVICERALDTINDPNGPRTHVLKLFCLGTTIGGRPLHPMARGRYRVPDHARPVLLSRPPGSIRGLGEPVERGDV